MNRTLSAKELVVGHRERIKERFLKSGEDDLQEYELLELLLTYAIPRVDVKPLAKTLIINFGSLGNVLSAPLDDLVKIKGIKEHTAILIKLVASMEKSLLKTEMKNKPHLTSWDAVENYCYALLGRETKEFVYIILLDTSCHVIDTVQIQKGTVNETAVYIRDVIELLVKKNATSFILVHNHPAGDTKPSKQDMIMTKKLDEVTRTMNIKLQDHFIVSPKGINSFKMMGLLG